jgi:hypothetical protein
VVTQVAKQYREQIAVALLAVAVVYLGCGLGLLFKSYDNSSIDFAAKSAADGYVFSHPVVVACIGLAVLLVAGWGEPSAHARTLVLAAVGIGALALVFALITWIAGFSSEEIGTFAGVQGAGKIVGAFLGLAQIALLVLALFFAGIAMQALPRPVQAGRHWGAPYQPGWGPGQDWQAYGDWPGSGYPGQGQHPGQQAPWASPPGEWGQPPGWQHPGQTPAWGQSGPPDQGWQQPPPGWQPPAEYDAPTEAYERPTEAEAAATPPSNAELYWRSSTEREPAPFEAEGAPADEPGSTAEQPAGPAEDDGYAESGAHRDDSAAAAATSPGDAEAEPEPAPGRVEERDDNSGWWRPSSSG